MLSHKEIQVKPREIQEQTANLVEFAIESAGWWGRVFKPFPNLVLNHKFVKFGVMISSHEF